MRFYYGGPMSGVTLREGEHVREVMLYPDTEVELPIDHAYTQTLLALRYLAPVQASVKPRDLNADRDQPVVKGA